MQVTVESPIRVDDSEEMTQKIACRLTWTQYPTRPMTASNYADYAADDTLITDLLNSVYCLHCG